jgi:glutamine cyclotransferase
MAPLLLPAYCTLAVAVAAAAALSFAGPGCLARKLQPELGGGIERASGMKDDGLAVPEGADYQVLGVYPHDAQAFTQGLTWYKGQLYESTGEQGKSNVRIVDYQTGGVIKSTGIRRDHFGEGMVVHNDKIHYLTWRSRTGYTMDPMSLALEDNFTFITTTGEGWGITSDGESLIVSDGSEFLHFWDPETHTMTRRVQVHNKAGRGLIRMNELEYIKGYVYANVWFSDKIYKIDPATGLVEREYDMSGLYRMDLRRKELNSRDAVLNGIAYDEENDVLFLTGKLWPRLYKVTLSE